MEKLATSRRMDQNQRIKQLWSREFTTRWVNEDVSVDQNKGWLEERVEALHMTAFSIPRSGYTILRERI